MKPNLEDIIEKIKEYTNILLYKSIMAAIYYFFWLIFMIFLFFRPIVKNALDTISGVSFFIFSWALIIGWFRGEFYSLVVGVFFLMSFVSFILSWLYDSILLALTPDEEIIFLD